MRLMNMMIDVFTKCYRNRMKELAKNYELTDEEWDRLCPQDQCDIPSSVHQRFME
ncbi:MAG: hypothetical protein RSD88_00535 [Anaerovoracaceae bacterium]